MSINNIPTINELNSLYNVFMEAKFPVDNIEVVIKVPTSDLLNRINSDFYYRNGGEGEIDYTEEINVNVNNLKVKYTLYGEV